MNLTRFNLEHIAVLLHSAGIRRIVVCPGSRNAPIVSALLAHGGLEFFSSPDERAGAFAALGMSDSGQGPAAVVCTSGTAVLNLYPALCEAYYRQVPMLAITADRPMELLGNWDGQTIKQSGIFAKHIAGSMDFPQDLDSHDRSTLSAQMMQQTLDIFQGPLKGPVHWNIPLRDPIYSDAGTTFGIERYAKEFKKAAPLPLKEQVGLPANIKNCLILIGQNAPDPALATVLKDYASQFPILTDICSNQTLLGIAGWEAGFYADKNPDLAPDCIISLGMSFVNKSLKQFLRMRKPAVHLHITENDLLGDPFFSKPHHLRGAAADTLRDCLSRISPDVAYRQKWSAFGQKGIARIKGIAPCREFQLISEVLENAGENDIIHLGNSMPVRYAGLKGVTRAEVFCNRGTSGIDGILSTAVGMALAQPGKNVICILGDISFFYDSNTFWISPKPGNLRVLLLNNSGGNIFEIIDGPGTHKELLPWVITPHTRNASHIAADHGLFYSNEWIHAHISGLTISEIKTDPKENLEFFRELKAE